MPVELVRSAERRAAALLARSDLGAGAAPELVAHRAGYQVKVRRTLGRKLLGRYDADRCIVFVAPRLAPTRRAFTVAHELGHASSPLDLPREHIEAWCDRFAAALLMPAPAFLECGRGCNWDLEALRRWWQNCSWTALVRRIAELVPGTAAAAWHRQKRKFWPNHPEVTLPEHADELEEFIACEALQGGHSELRVGGLDVRGWRTGHGRAVTMVRRMS